VTPQGALRAEKQRLDEDLKARSELFSRRETVLQEEVEILKDKLSKRDTVQVSG